MIESFYRKQEKPRVQAWLFLFSMEPDWGPAHRIMRILPTKSSKMTNFYEKNEIKFGFVYLQDSVFALAKLAGI